MFAHDVSMQKGETKMLKIRNPNIEACLRIYYSCTEIGCPEIKAIFGAKTSYSTMSKLKAMAREEMFKEGQKSFRPSYVNTKSAFQAWGIDIEDIEKGYQKLKKLGLGGQTK